MTPSINRLHDSAKALGEYILSCEYEQIREEFDSTCITDFPQFSRWVTGYVYYDALVCACVGNEENIMASLEQSYDELVAMASREAG